MEWIAAITAGLVGTAVISLMMAMAPRMGMPPMAIWELLGSMFDPSGNRALGWAAHIMMGVAFALIYAFVWSAGIGSATVLNGAAFGVVHWVLVGLAMGMIPAIHAGMRAGATPAPGLFMMGSGGLMDFMGGLVGHTAYGVVVALTYSAIAA